MPKWAASDSYAISARAQDDPTKDQYRLIQPNGTPLDADAPTSMEALGDELGLKLEQRTAALETLVVDHVEEPWEN